MKRVCESLSNLLMHITRMLVLWLSIAWLTSLPANAGLITYQTQDYNGARLFTDLRDEWFALVGAGAVVTDRDIDEFNQVYSGNRTFNRLVLDVDMEGYGEWTLDIGLDAGLGVQAYFNDQSIYKDTSDVWWNYNWNHGDMVNLNNLFMPTGEHRIELYWIEMCCNGFNSIRLTDELNNTVAFLSAEAMARAQISEPDIIAVLALALIFGASMRSKRMFRKGEKDVKK